MAFEATRHYLPEVGITDNDLTTFYASGLTNLGGTAYQDGPLSEPDRRDLKDFYSHTFSQGFLSDLNRARFISLDGLSERELMEHEQEFLHLAEGLLDLESHVFSYGVSAPSIGEMIARQRAETMGDGQNYRALLVGALTPHTVREFSDLVRMYFPDATRMIVDPEGIRTAEAAKLLGVNFLPHNFLQEDMAQMTEGPVDSIHTNAVLKMLKGTTGVALLEEAKRRMFFAQAGKVLKPGGRLMMTEMTTPSETTNDIAQMKVFLEEAGFVDIYVAPADVFANRRDVERFYLSGGRHVNHEGIKHANYLLQISAQKPI